MIPDNPDAPWLQRWDLLSDWLEARGLYTLCLHGIQGCLPGYSVASIKSPRFEGKNHAVVCCRGKVVWDPHPGGVESYGFDYSETFDHVILVPFDPCKAVHRPAYPRGGKE